MQSNILFCEFMLAGAYQGTFFHVYIASSRHEGWEISRQLYANLLYKPKTYSRICMIVSNFCTLSGKSALLLSQNDSQKYVGI